MVLIVRVYRGPKCHALFELECGGVFAFDRAFGLVEAEVITITLGNKALYTEAKHGCKEKRRGSHFEVEERSGWFFDVLRFDDARQRT